MANVIEATGTATACLSLIPPLTRGTGAPRVIGIAHPGGLPLGLPDDHDTQRSVLRETLNAAATMAEPGSYIELDHAWPERRSVAIREPPTPPPIAKLLTRKPWLLPRLIAGDIPTAHQESDP